MTPVIWVLASAINAGIAAYLYHQREKDPCPALFAVNFAGSVFCGLMAIIQ